ncbi:MAG: NTPase [Candidatus Hydrothermarchaeales archaeon]
MKLLITGQPGSGKTTLCQKVVEGLKDKIQIGGFVSGEIREGGIRKGFMIKDVGSGVKGILAHVDHKTGPRVGKYRVNLDDLNAIGVGAINRALGDCDLVIIDEIGPMELYSEEFVKAVKDAFSSEKHVIASIHFRTKKRLLKRLRLKEIPIRVIEEGNREVLLEEIVEKFD